MIQAISESQKFKPGQRHGLTLDGFFTLSNGKIYEKRGPLIKNWIFFSYFGKIKN